MLSRVFWSLLAAACLIWYSTITVYVAVRGGNDIKKMLGRLDRQREAEKD
jgi:hypothetical protein